MYSDGQIIYSMGTFQAEQDEDEYGPRMPAAHPGRSVSQGVSEVRAAPDEVEELAAAQPADKMRRLEEGGRAEDDEDVRAEQRAEGGADGNSQPEGNSATGVAGEGALGASAAEVDVGYVVQTPGQAHTQERQRPARLRPHCHGDWNRSRLRSSGQLLSKACHPRGRRYRWNACASFRVSEAGARAAGPPARDLRLNEHRGRSLIPE